MIIIHKYRLKTGITEIAYNGDLFPDYISQDLIKRLNDGRPEIYYWPVRIFESVN